MSKDRVLTEALKRSKSGPSLPVLPPPSPPSSIPQAVTVGIYQTPVAPRAMIRRLLDSVDPVSAALTRLEADHYWRTYFFGYSMTLHDPLTCGCWSSGNHKPVKRHDSTAK